MKNKQIVLHQYYRLEEVIIISTDIYYTPIDKVSGEVWCGRAQQKTLDVYKETEAMGYDFQMSEDYVNLAVWNKSDTRVLTDRNGIAILDSSGNPTIVLDKGIKSTGFPLDEWDRCVHDAIVSLVVVGKCKMLHPAEILKVVCGIPSTESFTPADNLLKKVDASVQKISMTKIRLNFTREAQGSQRKMYSHCRSEKFRNGDFMIDAYLLPIEIDYSREKPYRYLGDPDVWDDLPALYRYASPKKQIASIKLNECNILDTKTTASDGQKKLYIRKDGRAIVLEHYLHRRINSMYSPKISHTILVEPMFKELHFVETSIDELDKYQKNKIMKKIETLLDIWTEKGFIASWRWDHAVRENQGFGDADIKKRVLKKGKLIIGLPEKSKRFMNKEASLSQ